MQPLSPNSGVGIKVSVRLRVRLRARARVGVSGGEVLPDLTFHFLYMGGGYRVCMNHPSYSLT